MTSSPSDMSIMDLLFDKVDPLLKSGIKDESFIDDSYDNDNIANEEWTTTTSYQDDFLNSFLCDNQFSLMDQETITKGLDTIPSPSSDSGLSSAFSLSCEQQLSPLLPIDDDQMEITNSCLYSPQNPMELDYLDSPNQSVSSVDSSARSVVSSNVGSPLTETTEEMECHQTFLTIVNPQVAEDINDGTTIDQKPIIDFDTNPKQRVHIASHENTINLRNISCNGKRNVRQLIRVTPIGSRNSRSLLLPLNSSDIKEVRTIKIVNAVPARNLKGFKLNQGNVLSKNLQIKIKKEDLNSEKIVRDNNEVTENISQYHPLKLNAEEKRLLQKEGITLPTHYPLTKTEERELKRIRRKIRNKISAQDSRKRKKEYVDGLEDRVKQCTEENLTLLKRIKVLQSQNQSLAGQLKRLQALIQKGNKSAQPATCLMVFLLSLALVAAPNLRPHSNANSNELSQEQKQEKITPLAGRSRTLLYTRQLMEEELQQYGEELLQEVEGLMDHDYSPIQMPVYKKQRFDSELSDKNILTDLVGGTLGSINNINSNPSLKYIEPPLDDDWPPPKPGGLSETKIVDKLEVLTKELKLNISDTEGIRTVLVNVPKE